MDGIFKTGDVAQTSGFYEVLSEAGLVTVLIAKGDRFPPYKGDARSFKLHREVVAKYTTLTSAAAMDETTATFTEALESLANK
jgi:hypothetical protein